MGDSCAIYHLALKYRQPRGRRLALGPHGQQVGVLGTLGVATDAAASIWHSSIRDSIASAAAAAALRRDHLVEVAGRADDDAVHMTRAHNCSWRITAEIGRASWRERVYGEV